MFKLGLLFDLRIICPLLLVFLLLGFITALNNAFLHKKILKQILYFLSLFLSGIIAFFILFCAFLNFYYFKTYNTKIDIFIFGLKDDDTMAILKIIFLEYPIFIILFSCLVFAIFCFKMTKIILNSTKEKSKILLLILTIFLLPLLIIGARGGVGTFPLREENSQFSSNQKINDITTNPIMAFFWALKHYKKQGHFEPTDANELKAMQDKLFDIFHSKSSANNINPHIVAVLLESFGSNALFIDDKENFDLLGSFREHFENGKTSINLTQNLQNFANSSQNDFTFLRSLSSANGTAISFAELFFISSNPNITTSKFKNKNISLTPFDIYKKAGYRLIFITSGSHGWQNFGKFLPVLGVDEIYDSNYIMAHFKDAKIHNAFGVLDEFAYNLAYEILSKAKEPVFMVILSTTNHPPFKPLSNYTPPEFTLNETIKNNFKTQKPNEIKLIASIFNYASSAFGDFISKIKTSNFSYNVIVAASGDHMSRDIKAQNLFLQFATPIYFYIPKNLQENALKFGNFTNFNSKTLASHKDIFPTLYALSLQNYDFLSLGGRNLFSLQDENLSLRDDIKNGNFSLNENLLIVQNCIFTQNSNDCLHYEVNKNGFLEPTKTSKQENFNAMQFFKDYKELHLKQLNYRIFLK